MITLQASCAISYSSLKRIQETGIEVNQRLGAGRSGGITFNRRADGRRSTGAHRHLQGGGTMVTFDDCLALCELTEDEVDAIAEHENLTQTAALEMGSYLIEGPDGALRIQRIILDDIAAARSRGDLVHAARLKQTLRQFIERHPGRRSSE
jgi:hypothetical protein